ncbi:hypothetical protein D9O50_02070 [Oxalobacteraceae bacterium CAVE-383]|nr:hypothetical protein D9O50_02070 [Oxalobacteraceae bacterium CAVE-383]
MSQVTIVDDVLNFTELNASTQHAAERSQSDENAPQEPAKSLSEEEQRMVHELTSILISGRLPA